MIHAIGRKALAALAVVLCTPGCAHKPPRVDCDGKLQPINLPAAVQPEGTRRPSDAMPSLGTALPLKSSEDPASDAIANPSGVSPKEKERMP
jgi:hypothetical protein